MSKTRWKRVSSSSPCPICRKNDWCRISEDGMFAGCMRIEIGSFKSKHGRDGSKVSLHRIDGVNQGVNVQQPPPSKQQVDRANIDILHSVYKALLGQLTLLAVHRDSLKARGLTDEAIDRGGYRSLPLQGRAKLARELLDRFGDKLLGVPGFTVKEGKNGSYLTLGGPAGLILPCRDCEGQIIALKIRSDNAGEGRPRYCYVSSKARGGPGPGAPIHYPIGFPKSSEFVRLTEGELKADVVQHLTRMPTLSIPGVGNWRPAMEVLKGLGCTTVRLAFDSDAWDNPVVARALTECAEALTKAGYVIELDKWLAIDGKGLDDLLAAGKSPEVIKGEDVGTAIQEALTISKSSDEIPQPDELSRLQEVLDTGDAKNLFSDRPLLQAIANLKKSNPSQYASLRASMRGHVSLRDLDRALKSCQCSDLPVDDLDMYFELDGSTYRRTQTNEGMIAIKLSNFTARIVEDVEHDDGTEKSRFMVVQGTLADGTTLPRVEVPAVDFSRMEWIVPAWGTKAVVLAGMGIRDHMRAAIQLVSGNVPRLVVYCHLGWRKIDNSWMYLHAGGAIGKAGPVEGIQVALPEPLKVFELSPPPDAAHLATAVQTSLKLLELGPAHITYPLIASIYRAVLGQTDFGLHLSGPTGTYKSEAAALVQQHFGSSMDARHLPANWSSTANALEGLAFVAKDALMTVDDFCPVGSPADVQRYHKDADRLFRGQGNGAGRQRMRPDASQRPPKPPRGLVLSTGEDIPNGQSLRARLLVLDISPGDLGPLPPDPNPKLTACQTDAAAGLYAQALAGFVQWLAPQLDDLLSRRRSELAALRAKACSKGQHARTPGIVADLALGLRYFLDFAVAANAISPEKRDRLWKCGWEALIKAASSQASQISTTEPAGLFMRLLFAALVSGAAHIANEHGNEPREPQQWGWWPVDGPSSQFKPKGSRIGWLVDGELYLEPEVSHAVVQQFARDQNQGFNVSAETLRRRLKEKGFLASTDKLRERITIRKTLQGQRREVLHVSWNQLLIDAEDTTGIHSEDVAKMQTVHEADTVQPVNEPSQAVVTSGISSHSMASDHSNLGRLNFGVEKDQERNIPEQAAGWAEWK